MDQLWAPWRIGYVKKPERGGCIFCSKQKLQDEDAFIVRRGKTCFSLLNIYPYNNGHLMVAPKRHIRNLSSLSLQERRELMEFVVQMQVLLKRVFRPDGFNIGLNLGRVAGAGIVGHLHFHIVPRWNGDTNFMPVIGRTKVIPQALEETYKAIRKAIR